MTVEKKLVAPKRRTRAEVQQLVTEFLSGGMRRSEFCRSRRLSLSTLRDRQPHTGNLTLDRIMAIFTADLRHRRVDFQVPSDPLVDTAWILMLQRIYADSAGFCGKQ